MFNQYIAILRLNYIYNPPIRLTVGNPPVGSKYFSVAPISKVIQICQRKENLLSLLNCLLAYVVSVLGFMFLEGV